MLDGMSDYSRINDQKSPLKGSRPSVPHGTNFYIFISKMKNNRYDMKIVHRYNIDILILIRISLHENAGRVCMDLHLHRVNILVLILLL